MNKKKHDTELSKSLSKSLSWLLRHGCEKSGLKFLHGGFLYVDDILKLPTYTKYTEDDIRNVVAKNNKQRFTLENEGHVWKIRANQGHTIEVPGLDLQPVLSDEDLPVVIHGTNMVSWHSIKLQGLKCMARNHIHFAPGEPGQDQVISGMRKSCQVWIYLDIQKAIDDGLLFYRSSNNVILSPGDSSCKIDPYFFHQVLNAKSKMPLDFEPIRIKNDQPKGDNSDATSHNSQCDNSLKMLEKSVKDLKL